MNILDTSVGDFCMTSPQVAPAGHSLMSDTVKHSCRILLRDTFLRSFLRLLFLWGTLWKDDTLHRFMSYATGSRVAMEKLPEGIKNRMSGRWVHHGPEGWQLHLVRFQRLCWSMFCLSLSARRDVLLVAEAHLASAILRACFIGNRFPQEDLILPKWLSHTRASSKSASLESLTRASSKSAVQGCLTRVSDKCGSCLPQKVPDNTKQCQKNEVNKTVGHGTLRQGMHTAEGSSSRNLRFVSLGRSSVAAHGQAVRQQRPRVV